MKTVPVLGTSIARPVGSGVVRVPRNLAFHLPGISPAVREKDAPCQILRLARGQVHRLDQAGGVREIQVLDGTLWLTTTPANGDVLLRSGERFSLSTAWPIVFEAMQDASVMLVRR